MTDADFLPAILADPDDDAPRLVYADWLEERGDPRGEFIRAQCALAVVAARLGTGDETARDRGDADALRDRERDLLRAHGEGWAAALARPLGLTVGPGTDGGRYDRVGWGCLRVGEWPDPTFIDLDWRRGFVGRLTCTAADWLRHADALLRCTPVREVRLTTWPDSEDGWETVVEPDGTTWHRHPLWPGVRFRTPARLWPFRPTPAPIPGPPYPRRPVNRPRRRR